MLMEKYEEDKLKLNIYHTKKYHLFIKYFAEGGECFPMEVKPAVNIAEYDIAFNPETSLIMRIKNLILNTDIKFHDMVLNEI